MAYKNESSISSTTSPMDFLYSRLATISALQSYAATAGYYMTNSSHLNAPLPLGAVPINQHISSLQGLDELVSIKFFTYNKGKEALKNACFRPVFIRIHIFIINRKNQKSLLGVLIFPEPINSCPFQRLRMIRLVALCYHPMIHQTLFPLFRSDYTVSVQLLPIVIMLHPRIFANFLLVEMTRNLHIPAFLRCQI